ncbi:30S ribosomal protein S15 [Nanoarchaeota archaeon]
MARMHSRKKGKSGSTKPNKMSVPSWSRYKPKEAELLIVKLAKEGKSSSEIGIVLRDVYGIPNVKTFIGKKLVKFLEEKKLTKKLPEDLTFLIRKALEIRKHMEENHKDNTAKRGLQLTESKILRLVKYYKANKKIAQDWKYNPSNVKIYLE